jgi:hypothetical protein
MVRSNKMKDLETFLNVSADAERTGEAEATDRLLADDFLASGPVGFMLPKTVPRSPSASGTSRARARICRCFLSPG